MTADLTTQTPAQIDTAWAEATAPIHAKLDREESGREFARSMREKVAASGKDYAYGYSIESAEEKFDKHAAAIKELRKELHEVSAPFVAEWTARGGWTRAYLVTNGNGHIHSSTNCSTCYPTTQFYWVTELSGHTTDEIADRAGEKACTVCYPNAPVNKPTSIFSPDQKAKAATKAEREAKRAEKAAKEAAAAILDVDGQPLRDRSGYIIKTERTARNNLTDALLEVMMLNGPTYLGREDASEDSKAHWTNLIVEHKRYAQRLIEAIANKNDTVGSKVYDEHQPKAEKKFAKFLKEWDASPYNPKNMEQA